MKYVFFLGSIISLLFKFKYSLFYFVFMSKFIFFIFKFVYFIFWCEIREVCGFLFFFLDFYVMRRKVVKFKKKRKFCKKIV